MNLEILQARAREIDTAITNSSAQLNALQGHKAEVAHWIIQEEAELAKANETQVELTPEPMLA